MCVEIKDEDKKDLDKIISDLNNKIRAIQEYLPNLQGYVESGGWFLLYSVDPNNNSDMHGGSIDDMVEESGYLYEKMLHSVGCGAF